MLQKPVLNSHPENRYYPMDYSGDVPNAVQYNGTGVEGPPIPLPHEAFERTAFKLGRAIRELTKAIAANPHLYGEQAPNAARLDHFIHDALFRDGNASFSDAGLQVLKQGQEDTPENRLASLQESIIMECNRNWSVRNPTPDYARDWSFCTTKAPGKKYFSLDKWPLQFQTRKRQKEIVYSTKWVVNVMPPGTTDESIGAAVGGQDYSNSHYDEHDTQIVKRKAGDDLGIITAEAAAEQAQLEHDKNTRWFRGDALYPFGETVIQQAWQSMKIDQDLKDG